jgi:hypothetical protein
MGTTLCNASQKSTTRGTRKGTAWKYWSGVINELQTPHLPVSLPCLPAQRWWNFLLQTEHLNSFSAWPSTVALLQRTQASARKRFEASIRFVKTCIFCQILRNKLTHLHFVVVSRWTELTRYLNSNLFEIS